MSEVTKEEFEGSINNLSNNLTGSLENVQGNIVNSLVNVENNLLNAINSENSLEKMLKTEEPVIYNVNNGLSKNNPTGKIFLNNSFTGLINSTAVEFDFKANIAINNNKVPQIIGVGTDSNNQPFYSKGMNSIPAYSDFDHDLENTAALDTYSSNYIRRYIAKSVNAFDGDIISTSATMRGLYTVLDALDWKNDDVFVSFDWHYLVDYGSFSDFIAKYERLGIKIHNVNITCKNPVNFTYEEALDYYITKLEEVIEEQTALGRNVKMVEWDDVSWQGPRMPTSGMCDYLEAKGILSMVDGAHVYGIIDLDLSSTGPYKNCDFYVSNLHKYFNGIQGQGFIHYKGGANNRLGLKHVGPYYYSGVPMLWCQWASWQNTVNGAALAANSYLIKKYMEYGFKNIEENMRNNQKYLAEKLVLKFGQNCFVCGLIFNDDNTLNTEATNKACGPQVFFVPVEVDKFPELFVDYAAGKKNGRYEYNNTLLPNKSPEITQATDADIRSSFVGKVWTAIYLRGIVTRNTNNLVLDKNGDKIKLSTVRVSIGMQTTLDDVRECFKIVVEEYDKLIAGYKKCRNNIPYWEENDRYLTDPDVKYLFEINGNFNRDWPQVFGSDLTSYAPNSTNANSITSLGRYESYKNSATTGKVYNEDGKLVDGEVQGIINSSGETIMTWVEK